MGSLTMKPYLEEAYDLKSLVEKLFGRRAWSEVKNSNSLRTWRKYGSRILSAIEKSASLTVTIADSDWHDELHVLVEQAKARLKKADNTEVLFASLAASLAKISFHQLGRVPDNRTISEVTLRDRSQWVLNSYRSIQYVQDSQQRLIKKSDDDAKGT
jgi:hypothetical protein